MNKDKKTLSCAEVNRMDLVDFLTSAGYIPARISHLQYWFLSPLRTEKTASFKVNKKKNTWYDFGDGRGGTFVDFGILYFGCSVRELLHRLRTFLPIKYPKEKISKEDFTNESPIKIERTKTIDSPVLLLYLKERKIPFEIAKRWCGEIHFTLREKRYTSLGFQNDKGGYELRSAHFKGSTQPKDSSTIRNGCETLCVFEGFFDFLSFQTIYQNSEYINADFIILNSLSFLDNVKRLISDYTTVYLYLDNDAPRRAAAESLLPYSPKIENRSSLYHYYKDVNDWLMHFGLIPKGIHPAPQQGKLSG